MNTYDAIVIGAGPAGSTTALLLAKAGWSVAIVEKAEFPRRKVCGEFISAPALTLLTRAGLAENILADAGPEVREVAVYAGERVITGRMPSRGWVTSIRACFGARASGCAAALNRPARRRHRAAALARQKLYAIR